MLVNPFLKMTNTLRAPQRRADVQQSKAVSPHPRTMTFPNRSGSLDLQEHMPLKKEEIQPRKPYFMQQVKGAFQIIKQIQ